MTHARRFDALSAACCHERLDARPTLVFRLGKLIRIPTAPLMQLVGVTR